MTSIVTPGGLAEFFVAGIEPADVPQFFPLQEADPDRRNDRAVSRRR